MSLSDIIYNQFMILDKTSSTKKKESILAANRNSLTFKHILYHTYNPYLRYHIRKIPASVKGKGYGELNHDTWVLLSKLSLRSLSGIAARESLFEYIETLSPAAGEILKLVIKKDLKVGIATKTVNKVFPRLIPVFESQLVEDWVADKAVWPMLIGPKIDGTRGEKRDQHIFTRRGHKITGVQHILDYMATAGVQWETSGELWIPGMPFRRSDGIIRSNKPQKQNVRYALFDAPNLTGTLDERLKYLSRTFYPLESRPLPPVCYIPHMLVNSMDEVDKMYNYWRQKGYEGLVGKDPKGVPKMGKSYQWMRRVSRKSEEFKVIGVYESEKMPGMMGGIILEGGMRVGSGFTAGERKMYIDKPHMIKGKYATIEYKEKTKTNLRQAIYKAIRWDI